MRRLEKTESTTGEKMADRDNIVAYCTETLDLHSFPDYGPMGLQFAGKDEVNSVTCAVSISKDVIERAKDSDLLIVHHGMFWNNESRVLDERVGGRLDLLEKYGLSVLAYHLALDAHPKIGNNILLARTLGMSKLHRWQDIGYSGEFKKSMDIKQFSLAAQQKLDGLYGRSDVFTHEAKREVQKVAVIAGGAAHYIVQAHRDGFDTFVTGEATEPALYLAQDLGMNFFAFGHDKTERSGVQKLARLVSGKFNIPFEFLPVDNPV